MSRNFTFEDVPISLIDVIREDGEVLNPRGVIRNTVWMQDSLAMAEQREPAKVKRKADGRFDMLDGHTRLASAKALGWDTLWCQIYEKDSDDPLITMAVSNVRQNYVPSASGRMLIKLITTRSMPLEIAARTCGMDTTDAQLLIDLANAPVSVQKRVDSGDMSLSAFKVVRDKPKSVQESAAELPKPTVKNVRTLTSSTGKPEQSVMTALLQQTESTLVGRLQGCRAQMVSESGTLSDDDKARMEIILSEMLDLIGELN